MQLTVLAPAPEGRAALEGQAVGRDMIGLEGEGRGQVVAPLVERFARRGENEIERDMQAAIACEPDGPPDVDGRVIAFQQPQLIGAERLPAQADAGDTERGQRVGHCHVDVGRVGLDRPLSAIGEGMPA